MYGYRARIGYCSPPFVTETFCHEFYQMAPKGVTLMITTLAVTSLSSPSTVEQISESHARSLEAAKAMARAGADVVVLGGNPINQSLGMENLDTICIQLGQEIGTKVVTSTQSQIQTCLCPASILLDVTDIDGKIRVNYGNRESGSNAARIAIQSAEPAYGIIGIMHMYRGFGWHRCRKTWRPTGLPNPNEAA